MRREKRSETVYKENELEKLIMNNVSERLIHSES